MLCLLLAGRFVPRSSFLGPRSVPGVRVPGIGAPGVTGSWALQVLGALGALGSLGSRRPLVIIDWQTSATIYHQPVSDPLIVGGSLESFQGAVNL
jgi:hypothetical protein